MPSNSPMWSADAEDCSILERVIEDRTVIVVDDGATTNASDAHSASSSSDRNKKKDDDTMVKGSCCRFKMVESVGESGLQQQGISKEV